MKRRGLWLGVLSALALTGCGPAIVKPPPVASHGGAWSAVTQSMPAVVSLSSHNACGAGNAACIGAVVAEMTRRFDILSARCSHEAPFALMYLRVTQGVSKQGDQRFRSQAFLNHLDAAFANLYFTAYDNWRSERHASVPEAWRIAFDAADRGTVTVLGDLLLGMNAHISRDLPFALARTGLREPDGRSGQADFNRVNGLLGNVTPQILHDEAALFDRTLTSDAALPDSQLGASSLQQLLGAWRSESWNDAKRLLAASTPAQRGAVARSIEVGAAGRARLIAALTSNLVIGPDAARRDAYCELQRSKLH